MEKMKYSLIQALELMRKGKKLTFDYQRDTTKYYFVKNDELWFKTKSGEEKISGLSIFKIDAKEWEIYEEPKPILDTEEKAYLEAILRPFKNRVLRIHKSSLDDYEYLWFGVKSAVFKGLEIFTFPSFKPDTMYKGMEVNKKYTPKELGLFDRKIY